VWRWDQQEPFGVNVPDENPSGLGAFEFPMRFPGQYFDKETNLHYNYFRDYDPGIGRYVQSDPIGFAGGSLSLYLYVLNDPLQGFDPFGTQRRGARNLRERIEEINEQRQIEEVLARRQQAQEREQADVREAYRQILEKIGVDPLLPQREQAVDLERLIDYANQEKEKKKQLEDWLKKMKHGASTSAIEQLMCKR
jgi:RHS repeat-associated protein